MACGLRGSVWRGARIRSAVRGVLAYGSRRPRAPGRSHAVRFPWWLPWAPGLAVVGMVLNLAGLVCFALLLGTFWKPQKAGGLLVCRAVVRSELRVCAGRVARGNGRHCAAGSSEPQTRGHGTPGIAARQLSLEGSTFFCRSCARPCARESWGREHPRPASLCRHLSASRGHLPHSDGTRMWPWV